jgi:hypothetical protein
VGSDSEKIKQIASYFKALTMKGRTKTHKDTDNFLVTVGYPVKHPN